MWRLLTLSLLSTLGGCATTTAKGSEARDAPRPGDLLFLDLACDECDAIARVTQEQLGVSGPALSHVGIVERHAGHLVVLEAWPRPTPGSVRRTPLEEFLGRVRGPRERARGHYRLRLPARLRPVAGRALAHGATLLGRPYDPVFRLGNGRYYCSELLFEAFRVGNGGQPFFPLRPMTFGRPGSAERVVWDRYYARLGTPPPEGRPGISPLGIYLAARQLGARTPPAVEGRP